MSEIFYIHIQIMLFSIIDDMLINIDQLHYEEKGLILRMKNEICHHVNEFFLVVGFCAHCLL